MEADRRTRFDAEGLVVGAGARVPFYAGAMHYWRVPPSQWLPCLRAMHGLGFTLVETYVPWRVHEPEQGALDWTGQRDLAAFVRAAKVAGLGVVLRPGPHVNAELTSFGIPDWVLADPDCQARTSRGTPAWLPVPPRAFPIPSYASRAFHAYVRAWFAAVAAVVEPLLAPDGPIVAIGVDNEAQLFFRTGAYDLDYHPDALAWWEEAGSGPAPSQWDPQRADACVQWVLWKDEYISRALGAFSTMLDEVGFAGLARFHNLPPGHHGLYDLRQIQNRIGGPVGIDAYTPRHLFPELRRRATALVGDARPIPIAFEVGVGFFPWFPPLDAADDPLRERDHLLTLLASGVRGFNLFMTVERDRYYGAAIAADATVEKHASWIAPLVATLREIDWPALRRAAPIAVINTRADERFGHATCTIDPMTPVLADVIGLGPGGATELGTDDAAIAMRTWHTAICRALELAQVPYAIVDEAALADELSHYRAVIIPTLERIDQTAWEQLHALAGGKTGGKTVVVIGPGTPTRDEFDQPLAASIPGATLPKRVGKLKAGSLDDLPGLAEDLAALAGDRSDAWRVERPDRVHTSMFARDGVVRAVFVLSDLDRAATAIVLADYDATLRDAITGEQLRAVNGRVSVAMHARGVRMFVVIDVQPI